MPLTLFHGTSTDRISYIEEDGLQEPFLTDLEDLAWEAAYLDAYHTHTDPLILKVLVEDTGPLRADLAMYRSPMFSVLEAMGFQNSGEYERAVRSGSIRIAAADDWQASLKTVHSVRYAGLIPPTDVQRLKTGEAEGG